MRLHNKIALRYIFSLRHFHMISFITLISIIGIVIGVAALISVLSIFNGFGEFSVKQLLAYDPHIRVSAEKGAWINNVDSLLIKIRKIPSVKAATPVMQARIIAFNKNNMNVIYLNSVDSSDLSSVSGISGSIVMGEYNTGKSGRFPGIVLGAGVADRLSVFPMDTISLMSPAMIERSVKTNRKKKGLPAVVTGVFQTHNKEYDELFAYAGAGLGKNLFNAPEKSAFYIDIKLDDIEKVDKAMAEIDDIIPQGLILLSWYDLHKDLYNIMKFEKIVTFIILSLIIIIAAFNVLAALSMSVVKKRPDIALLKSIGATDKLIRNIYMAEGLTIGLLSTLMGAILGLAFCYGKMYFGWFEIDTSKYLVPTIPISVHTWDVIIVVGFSLLLSFVATIYPAKRAAGTIIVNEIRSE